MRERENKFKEEKNAEENDKTTDKKVRGGQCLKEKSRWILWENEERNGKKTKVPKSASGSNIDPLDKDNWMDYEKAKEYEEKMGQFGIGFVFIDEDDIVGIDLDDVIDTSTEEVCDWAENITQKVGGLWEVSPSGTGLHGYVKADLEESSYEFDHPHETGHIEIYAEERFFTVTENYLRTEPVEHTEALEEVIETFEAINKTAEDTYGHKGSIEIPEEEVEKALEYVDPDCSYTRWRNIGFALADYYGEDKQRAEEVFREWSQSGSKYDDRADYYIKNIVENADPGIENGITVGTLIYYAKKNGYSPDFSEVRKLGTRLEERNNRYYIETGEREKELTNFVLRLKKKLQGQDTQKIELEVVKSRGENYEVTTETTIFNEPHDFRDAVCCRDDSFFSGSRADLHDIRQHVMNQNCETRKATHKIGIHGDEVVTPNQTYRIDGKSKEHEYVGRGSQMEKKWNVELEEDYDKEEVRRILEILPQTRETERLLPVIGWYYAALFSRDIRELEGEIPYLMISGNTEAGKTSTNETLQRMIGLDGRDEQADTTKFSFIKLLSSTTNIPVWIDEYKPSDISNYKLDWMRRIIRENTRGGSESRGNADQTVTNYIVDSPLVVSGEQEVSGAAEERRQVPVQFKDPREEHREAWAKLTGGDYQKDGKVEYEDGMDLEEHAKAVWNYVLQEDIEGETWKKAKERVYQILEENQISGIGDLGINGLAMIWVGLASYKQLSNQHGAEVHWTEEDEEEAILYVARQLGEENRMSHLDEFLSLVYTAAREGMLVRDEDIRYIRDDPDENLRLKVKSCHHKISKYLKNHGLQDEYDLLRAKDYKNRIKDADEEYVVDYSVNDSRLNRCVEINDDLASEMIEGFEEDLDSTDTFMV